MSSQGRTSVLPPISIELTAAQIDQVVLGATEGGTLSVLLGQGRFRGEPARTLETSAPELNDVRLSRSLLIGLWILALLPDDGSWVGLGPLVAETGLSKSTAHRYVTTLVTVGLAEREPITRKYRLAGLAVEHG
jgi:hypothetical protein